MTRDSGIGTWWDFDKTETYFGSHDNTMVLGLGGT